MERYRLEVPEPEYSPDSADPFNEVLQSRGDAHENAYLDILRSERKSITVIETDSRERAAELTLEALHQGADIIYQAYLTLPPFAGYADFLIKVPGASNLGDYHYEVWDTKLSRSFKAYFAIQCCCYAEMLAAVQGVTADEFVIVLGNNEQVRTRISDCRYFYETLKARFLEAEAAFDAGQMPDPADSREWGQWSSVAEDILKDRDHLSQVAGITRNQIKKLSLRGIDTMQGLIDCDQNYVPGLSPEVLARLRQQATMQRRSEGHELPAYEVILPETGARRGLALLPPASPEDIFFDIEGFPLAEGGLEYLWGVTWFDASGERQFSDYWAHDSEQEKAAFRDFVLWAYGRWKANPAMHIYHYGHYETAVCRRLMGRYGVCEQEVDDLLRNEVFVDLHPIVRHGFCIGEPRYSIKNVEHLYRSARATEVASGGDSVVMYERWCNAPDGDSWRDSEILKSIRDYNIDDCNSTQELVDWLRNEQVKSGIQYLGEEAEPEQNSLPDIDDRGKLRDQLLEQAEQEKAIDPECARVTEVMAWLLEFHRREQKPMWWQMFDRLGLTEMELADDLDCIASCVRTGREPYKETLRAKKLCYEYTFDADQDYKAPKPGCLIKVHGEPDQRYDLVEFDGKAAKLVIKGMEVPPDQTTLIPVPFVRPEPIPTAIEDVANQYAEGTLGDCAIMDFLHRRRPRIKGHPGGSIVKDEHDLGLIDQVIEVVLNLDNSYLCIQGPPGAGKTYTGKHVIAELVRRNFCVGIASNSHKAINNLLTTTARYCMEQGITTEFFHTCKNTGPEIDELDIFVIKNNQLPAAVNGSCVLGSTAWGFAQNDMVGMLDYLFVDEAGQVSVANLVGMSRCTRNIILKGDQMQLGQPTQGSHPGESGLSVLEYLLQDHATISSDLGVFLGVTYRMHPAVNEFISEAIYEGRLEPAPGNERQIVKVPEGYKGSLDQECGLHFIAVEHEGNTQGSQEEAEKIREMAEALLGRIVVDKGGTGRALGWDDILFVTPYNHQLNILSQILDEQARVGTVDKFQGQEAPVVIVSLCASNVDDAARGLEFIFDRNRLNVAISRAKSLAYVVGSPTLAAGRVENLKQLKLMNLACQVLSKKES